MKNLEVYYVNDTNIYYIIHNNILYKFRNYLEAKEYLEDFYENVVK